MYLAKINTAMNIDAFVNLVVQSIELSWIRNCSRGKGSSVEKREVQPRQEMQPRLRKYSREELQSRLGKCSRDLGSAVERMECSREWEVQSRDGSAVESDEVQSRVRKCSREYGSAVEGMEVQSREWKYSREKKCSRVMKMLTISAKKKTSFFLPSVLFLGLI